MRRPLIAGNWKMFKSREEARDMVRDLIPRVARNDRVEVVVCPPFTSLPAVAEMIQGSPLQLGAQDVHWEEQGAFTGEISAPMLLDCGCRYVIIGHSERRQYFQESDAMIHQKLKKVLNTPLLPILCVGESLQEREAGRLREVVFRQLEQGLEAFPEAALLGLVIAYEPVWAIGTGKTATPEIAQQAHGLIRGWLQQRYSDKLGAAVRILYGGSVKPENITDLMAQQDIDGALVGGASLEAENFAKIVNYGN